MKKIIAIALLLAFVAGAGALFAQQQRLRNGTFTGTGEGYLGEMTVTVTVARNRISAITVTESADTAAFVTMVTTQMVPAMIQAQSAQVDLVTGATATSEALVQAVEEALTRARR